MRKQELNQLKRLWWKMNKETDLSSQWLEAWRLRQEGKEILKKNGVRLTDELEAQIFEEADKRLDSYFEEKRRGITKHKVK